VDLGLTDGLMKKVFDVLSRYGFKKNNSLRRLSKLGDEKLQDFALDAAEAMRGEHIDSIAKTPFAFIANGALSGEPHPCQAMTCRLNRVDSVARFASLYGDQVLLGDPFEQVVLHDSFGYHAIADLLAAVEIMYALRPAIDAGFVRFASRRLFLCDECSASYVKRRSKSEEHLLTAISSKARATLTRDPEDDYLVLNVFEAPGWIEHGSVHFHRVHVPSSIKRRLGKNNEYTLKKTELRSLDQIKHMASTVTFDVALQERFAQKGFSYLTDRELDFEAISDFEDQASHGKRKAMLTGLQHALPSLTDVPLSKIVKLRKTEPEAFAVYRDSLRTILDELSTDSAITVSRVKQAVSDCVQPEINKIKRTIRENRKTLWTSLKEDVLFGGLIASCGLYAGHISPTCGAVMAAVGGAEFARKALVTANKICKEPEEIRKSNYYFLWRALS
jgi:hypothetical protein